jgi:hypothetical protein
MPKPLAWRSPSDVVDENARAQSSQSKGSMMEPYLTIVRAIGDMCYLVAALLTIAVVYRSRDGRG